MGQAGNEPHIALTELVANAWDAGASRVEITIPAEEYSDLIVEDNGVGLTSEQFRLRWMTLGYNRLKHQGEFVEFPIDGQSAQRKAYGRNGIGRHGMLCFADEYMIETHRDDIGLRCWITSTSGEDPFKIEKQETYSAKGHGTKLVARIAKNLPNPDEIREILSARFLYDPQFQVSVNGYSILLTEHKGLIEIKEIKVGMHIKLEMYIIDSSKVARTAQQHGVAMWVGNRLVGEPSWVLGDNVLLDGRTWVAKRYTIVVRTEDLFDEILPDWTGFKPTITMKQVYQEVAAVVDSVLRRISIGKIDEIKKKVVREHRTELSELRSSGKRGVSEFIDEITALQPTIAPEELSVAVRAVINLEKSRDGMQLLQKISHLSIEDIVGLNRLLDDWTVKDALSVLDEIDNRMLVIEALERFSSDKAVDELHTLHPLVAKARWLFGPEYDSPLYTSNITIRNVIQKVFDQKIDKNAFVNYRRRPDIVVVGNSTISAVGADEYEDSSNLPRLKKIMVIELKKGGYKISRAEMNQASDYVEDILNCGLVDGNPQVIAYVVGHEVDTRIERVRKIGEQERGRVEACTYGLLIRSAQIRLFNLKQAIQEKYDLIAKTDLLEMTLAEPEQMILKEEGA